LKGAIEQLTLFPSGLEHWLSILAFNASLDYVNMLDLMGSPKRNQGISKGQGRYALLYVT
jgi:hypothetical protein